METKICTKCQSNKPLKEFRERYPGSYSALCKQCLSNQTQEYSRSHMDKVIAYRTSPESKIRNKIYHENRNTPEYREKARKRNSEYYYKLKEAGLLKTYKPRKPCKPRDPAKVRCKKLLRYEIKMGRVERQPCSICGKLVSEGHHPDYSKPLEVVWLCRTHHMNLHRKYQT